MTLQLFKGDGPVISDPIVSVPAFATGAVIDASDEKVAFMGCVWHPTIKTGTINIRKIHFGLAATTLNVLSTMRISLQDYSLTGGPPYQPDGTQDQTFDYVGAVNPPSANAWNTTGNLSADRVVNLSNDSIGDANSRWLAIVFEYQTFTAADSIQIRTVSGGTGSASTTLNTNLGGCALLQTSAVWGFVTGGVFSDVVLECDDGTFAYLDQGMPYSAISSVTTANNAAIRAAGLRFRFPFSLTIEGLGMIFAAPNNCDGTFTLYDSDGTTVLREWVIDNDAVAGTTGRLGAGRFTPVTLLANTYYRFVFIPTTTTAATVYYGDVNVAGFLDAFMGGQDFHWTQRDSAGVWTDTTTRRCFPWLKLSSVDDGLGGGIKYHQGTQGGLNG